MKKVLSGGVGGMRRVAVAVGGIREDLSRGRA